MNEQEARRLVEEADRDIEYFKELAEKARFKIVNEWTKGGIFHLELSKS